MEFIIRTPLDRPIFAALAISTHFEIARRLEGKTARGRGELVGGTKLSPFFVVYIQKIRCEWLTQPKQ